MNQTAPSHRRPVVALLTDFGLSDGYIGVMKGVIASISTEAHIIDITHAIAPQNVLSGAWILASVYRYFPRLETHSPPQSSGGSADVPPVQAPGLAGTVFVCVIDPGVGSSRGAIAVRLYRARARLKRLMEKKA